MSLLFIIDSLTQQIDVIAFVLALFISLLFYYQYKKYVQQIHCHQAIDQLFEE